MSNSIFKHAKCGGNLTVDISNLFSFKSPSLGVCPDGISIGVMELTTKNKPDIKFVCEKCEKDVPFRNQDEINVMCDICKKPHPASETLSMYQIRSICSGCFDMLTGTKSPTESIKKITEYLVIPKDQIRSEIFSNLLNKKLEF